MKPNLLAHLAHLALGFLALLVFQGARSQTPDFTICNDIATYACPCRSGMSIDSICQIPEAQFESGILAVNALVECLTTDSITDCSSCPAERAAVSVFISNPAFFTGGSISNLTCNGTGLIITARNVTTPARYTGCYGATQLYTADACCDASPTLTLPTPMFKGPCLNFSSSVNADLDAVATIHNALLCFNVSSTYGDACVLCLGNMTLSQYLATLPGTIDNSVLLAHLGNVFSVCSIAGSTELSTWVVSESRRRLARADHFETQLSDTLQLSVDPVNIVRARSAYDIITKASNICQQGHFDQIVRDVSHEVTAGTLPHASIIFAEFIGVLTSGDLAMIVDLCSSGTIRVLRLGQTSVSDEVSCEQVGAVVTTNCPSLRHLDFQNCAPTAGKTQVDLVGFPLNLEGASFFSQDFPPIDHPEDVLICGSNLKYLTITAPITSLQLEAWLVNCYPQLCALCLLNDPSFVQSFASTTTTTVVPSTPLIVPPPVAGRCPFYYLSYDNPTSVASQTLDSMIFNRTFCLLSITNSLSSGDACGSETTPRVFKHQIIMGGCDIPNIVLQNVELNAPINSTVDFGYAYFDRLTRSEGSGPLPPLAMSNGPIVLHSGCSNLMDVEMTGFQTRSFRALERAHLALDSLSAMASAGTFGSLEHLDLIGTLLFSGGVPLSSHSISSVIAVASGLRSIRLADLGLAGTIPTDLCALSYLGTPLSDNVELADAFMNTSPKKGLSMPRDYDYPCIDLSLNRLTGSIPACFSSIISTCDYINLSSNNLTGNIPNFPTMRRLDLSNNPSLTGTIPTTLAGSSL